MGMFVAPVHHMVIIVSDLDKALSFWRDTLGWEVITGFSPTRSEEASVATGVAGKHRSAVLSQEKGIRTGWVELVEFSSPSGKPFPPDEKFSDVGLRLLSFAVIDIDKAYQELQAKGCRFNSPPQRLELPGGRASKACIFREPVDGIQIEIFQFLRRGQEGH